MIRNSSVHSQFAISHSLSEPSFNTAYRSFELEQEVTILMCDLVDSTSLANRLSAKDMGNLLVNYYAVCQDIVEKRGGKIIRCIGDGVVALFKSQKSGSSHAPRAVSSAIDIHRNFLAGKFSNAAKNLHLSARISVVTGRGICARLDSLKQDVVFGKLPFLAERLNKVAQENEIVLNALTAASISPSSPIHKVGCVSLKGFNKKVELWKVSESVMGFVDFTPTNAEVDLIASAH